jgi:uncharacterized protein DUF4012
VAERGVITPQEQTRGTRPPASRATFARRQRRRRIAIGSVVTLGVLVLVGGAAAFRVFQVSRDLSAAKDQLVAAEGFLKQANPGAARVALVAGERRVNHANSIIHNAPELGLVGLVPGGKQNLDAIKSSVGLALRMAGTGRRVLDTAAPLQAPSGKFEVPLKTGAIPLPVLRRLQPEIDDLQAGLALLRDAPHSSLLVAPVKRLVHTVYEQSDLRKRQLTTISAGLTLLRTLSGDGGPHRYLLAIANDAEMRGTGGMILSYGELAANAGTFTLEHFGSIDELKLGAPAVAPQPADYTARFSALAPTLEWRNANLGGDFTYLAPAMEAMYTQATSKPVDGVVQIDSFGLAALLRGTGPVDVAGLGTVTADNVVQETLSTAYERFENRGARQEVLGDVAEAVCRKLVTGDYPSLRPLATALVDSVAQRRIMLHLSSKAEQRDVAALLADGALPAGRVDFASLTVQNFSANKLDYYLDTSMRLSGTRRPGQLGRVRVEVTISDAAPPTLVTPTYVFGPNLPTQLAGQYVGLASLYLPKGAALVGQSGDLADGRAQFSTEDDRTVISFPVRVSGGQSQHVSLDIALPPPTPAGYVFDLVPQSRVRATTASLDLDAGPGSRVAYSGPLTQSTYVTARAG